MKLYHILSYPIFKLIRFIQRIISIYFMDFPWTQIKRSWMHWKSEIAIFNEGKVILERKKNCVHTLLHQHNREYHWFAENQLQMSNNIQMPSDVNNNLTIRWCFFLFVNILICAHLIISVLTVLTTEFRPAHSPLACGCMHECLEVARSCRDKTSGYIYHKNPWKHFYEFVYFTKMFFHISIIVG